MSEAEVATAPAPVLISLKTICEQVGVKPTMARQRLRAKLDTGKAGFRWEFPEDQVQTIKDLITPKVKAPAEAATATATVDGDAADDDEGDDDE